MKTTTDALRAIMAAYKLTRGDVCLILGLIPRKYGGSHGTVDAWLSNRTPCPRAKLELIHQKAPTYKRPPSPAMLAKAKRAAQNSSPKRQDS